MENFINEHRAQLEAGGLPEHLWKRLFVKLRAGIIGFQQSADPHSARSVVDIDPVSGGLYWIANEGRKAESDVLIFPHMLTFQSTEQLQAVVEERPQIKRYCRYLVECASRLHSHAYAIDINDNDNNNNNRNSNSNSNNNNNNRNSNSNSNNNAIDIDALSTKNDSTSILFTIAFQYQLAMAGQSPQNYYYIMSDELSPLLMKFSPESPIFQCFVLISSSTDPTNITAAATGEAVANHRLVGYTIVYPVQDISGPGMPLSRSELTIMPNYAHPAYWPLHYTTSGGSTQSQAYEWFAGFSDLQPLMQTIWSRYSLRRNGILINVGCGNSSFARNLLTASMAAVVMELDISPNVLRLSAKATPPHLCEEFLAMDLMSGSDCFRSGPSCNFADIVLDKGTLDGMLRVGGGVEMLRDIWQRKFTRWLNPVNGIVILISLGSPQSRLPLIEQQLGWTVEDAFECEASASTTTTSTTTTTNAMIKTVYVYVCKYNNFNL